MLESEVRMATNEAALKAGPDVVDAKDGDSRERSSIGFPYLDLDDSVEITKSVHTIGGSTCQWDQLAARLGQAANGGGFRMRMQTAKMFGLLNYDRGTVSLTPTGSRIADPEQERAARADAFLKIPLYNRIHEEFKNATLPPDDGLENAMVNMGVSSKQKGRARQVFQRSARQAGFFEFGTTRLVMPSIKGSAAPAPAVTPTEHEPEPEKKKKKQEDEGERHPLIDGLLKELPEPRTEWSTEDRKKWLEMASTIFNMIYKDSDDSRGSLKVVVERNSAK
jgi:hypothetical protein